MDFGFVANAEELAKKQDFSPLPDGWYLASVTSADLRETKAGNGKYIAVRYDIMGPTHQGRIVFGNMNIENPSQKAEEIGRQQLGALILSIGLKTVRTTEELVGGICQIQLITKESPGYEARNEIKNWKKESTMPAQVQEQIAAPEQKDTPSNNPPWAR